jgi:hypothetical protein
MMAFSAPRSTTPAKAGAQSPRIMKLSDTLSNVTRRSWAPAFAGVVASVNEGVNR